MMTPTSLVTSGTSSSKPFVDIIWNMTVVCPWPCAKCCVDAVHTEVRNGLVAMRSGNLETLELIPRDGNSGSIYDQAAALRQARGLELNLAGKLRILEHLSGFDAQIDFSGGDPLVLSDTMIIIREARRRGFRITLTATGPGFSKVNADEIASIVDEVNFTYDGEPPADDPNCPVNYASSNLRQAASLARANVATRAECPLTLQNIRQEILQKIYLDLHAAQIDKFLVLRLFPVGRGQDRVHQIPTAGQYFEAIAFLKKLEAKHGRPQVKVQCALKHLVAPRGDENPCDAILESFGLMANGVLLGSPWAINKYGQPLDAAWVLGNLAEQPLADILANGRVRKLRERANENAGHCKIFAFLNGASGEAEARMFERADPLYAVRETAGTATTA